MIVAPRQSRSRARPGAEAFESAEAAWFWTLAALAARREGRARSGGSRAARTCEPDDVLTAVDRLFRAGRIDVWHARALRRWGERGLTPDPARPGDCGDALLWNEAMDRLDPPLRARGIVA